MDLDLHDVTLMLADYIKPFQLYYEMCHDKRFFCTFSMCDQSGIASLACISTLTEPSLHTKLELQVDSYQRENIFLYLSFEHCSLKHR